MHAYNILCNLETVHSFIIGGYIIPGRGPLKPPTPPPPRPIAKNNRSDYIFQPIRVTWPVWVLNLAKFEDTAPLRQLYCMVFALKVKV